MKHTYYVAFILLAVLVGTLGYMDTTYADNTSINTVFTTQEAITVVFLGVLGGLLHAYQGYRTSSQAFDVQKFIDGVIMCVIASVPLAIGAAIDQMATGQQLGVFTYVVIFFASIGAGFQIQQTRQKTVPSDATIDPNTNKPIQ